MKNKILWGVIIALMVLDLYIMTIGGGRVAALFDSFRAPTFVLAIPPLIMCFCITLTKQYKRLWLIALPSMIQFFAWTSFEIGYALIGGYEIAGLATSVAVYQLLPGCLCALFAYMCFFIARKFKKTKNKEDSQ